MITSQHKLFIIGQHCAITDILALTYLVSHMKTENNKFIQQLFNSKI